jgi:RNA polymerase sigma-70 factor (ECF subfamily)
MRAFESKSLETESGGPRTADAQGGEPDEVLLRRVENGDADSFDEIIIRYQERVCSLLFRMCGSIEEAEDLTQETFIKAYRGLSGFRRGSLFYTWLFRIAVNVAYSRKRKLVRQDRVEGVRLERVAGTEDSENGLSFSATAEDADADPTRKIEQDELRKRVWAGLNDLDEEYRAVLLLRDMEGLDYDEAAEVLGISRSVFKSRLYRARTALAHKLKDLKP